MTDILKKRLPSPQNLGRAACKLWGTHNNNKFFIVLKAGYYSYLQIDKLIN